MANNPLPKHEGPIVNALEDADEGLVKDLFKVKTSMKVVHAKLSEAGLIEGMHDNTNFVYMYQINVRSLRHIYRNYGSTCDPV